MTRTLRVLVALVIVVLGVGLAPVPAQAMASGLGWSGSWRYTGGTYITVRVDVPGASVVANGWDALGVRAFVVTLTDTANDGMCAYVGWNTNAPGTITRTVCGQGKSVQFTPPTFDSDLVAVACRNTGPGTQNSNCNVLLAPTSKTDAFIRTPGNGLSWYYLDHADPDVVEDWAAHLDLGAVRFSMFGNDGLGSTRTILGFVEIGPNSPVCGSGEVLYGSAPAKQSVCGNFSAKLPQVQINGAAWGEGCLWAERGRLEQHCALVYVAEPS
ncbi:MAG TPA: hypothetical protein VFE14_09210 [Micromonosporaceae bacterium]|nr:hypothetical protein [Micromonosporaceae bacterium]